MNLTSCTKLAHTVLQWYTRPAMRKRDQWGHICRGVFLGAISAVVGMLVGSENVVSAQRVQNISARQCSTQGVDKLARQIVSFQRLRHSGELMSPSEFLEHPEAITNASDRVNLYLQPVAAEALAAAADDFFEQTGRGIKVNSGYRTIVEQYVLAKGCAVAAAPGASDHQGGLSVDIANWQQAAEFLNKHGFENNVPGDLPHFNYVESGSSEFVRRDSVLAFQELWNIANPDDLLETDGLYGPATEARVQQSPVQGFRFDLGAAFCSPSCYAGYSITASCNVDPCSAEAGQCHIFAGDAVCVSSPCEVLGNGSICSEDEQIRYECKDGEPVSTSECIPNVAAVESLEEPIVEEPEEFPGSDFGLHCSATGGQALPTFSGLFLLGLLFCRRKRR